MRSLNLFLVDVSKLDLNRYSMVIILGGHQRMRDINLYPGLINVVTLIKKCIEIAKPVLGICLGCQLIAYVLGWEIKQLDKLYIGYDVKIFNFDHIFRHHLDYVVPKDLAEIVGEYDGITYAFRHNNLFGIQCHPDISPDNVIKYHSDSSCKLFAQQNKEAIDKNNKGLLTQLLNQLKLNF